jgi:hypothetical protein
MKHLFTFLTLVSSLIAFCQAPDAMSYQAVIRDASNELVASQVVGMQISILQGSASGTVVYTETQTPTTNTNGLVSIAIGEGSTNDDFSSIDWADGPYFIKTETDPNGGSDYSITGTTQLLSVPYAMHAKTADNMFSGDYDSLENTPDLSIYSTTDTTLSEEAVDAMIANNGYLTSDSVLSEEAVDAMVADNGYLSEEADGDSSNELQTLSISNDTIYLTDGNFAKLPTGFSGDYDSLENKPDLSIYPTTDNTLTEEAVDAMVADNGYLTRDSVLLEEADGDATNEIQNLSVSATGDTLYLQNGGFVIILGISVANIYPPGTVHCTDTPTEVVDVINAITGKTWMDRNLGASQAATSSTDADAYGDLYQWGRGADGHQCRNSATTSTLSSNDEPGQGDFISSNSGVNYDWRSSKNDNLWQGVNGTNNPCPSGYRLPTWAELDAEHYSWISDDAAGAFASPLKLPMAGNRSNSNGSLNLVGSDGIYWSSTVDGTNSSYLYFYSNYASMSNSNRAYGFSVRCLKD